jgi:hypothetical protein
MGLDFWEPGITPIQARLKIWDANHGLNIITPECILPKFNIEPFTLNDFNKIFNYKRPNTSKLRSIMRKYKHK